MFSDKVRVKCAYDAYYAEYFLNIIKGLKLIIGMASYRWARKIIDITTNEQSMDEKEYTNNVIIPLLRHMGYMEVTYIHGDDEFGKDVLFSEYDRFGNKKYYAAQIKIGDISGNNKSKLMDIINHTQRAFNMDFPDLITKTSVSITDFFLITSGRFVGNAKMLLLDYKALQAYKHRIHFYEGHHIKNFSKKSYKDIKELYVAQLHELVLNIDIGRGIIKIIDGNNIIDLNYIAYNLLNLLTKLDIFGEQKEFRLKLADYLLEIQRNNNVIGQPIL